LRRLLGPFYFTGVFWYRAHLLAARIIPDWLMGSFLRVFTFGFYLALGNLRRALGANRELIEGPVGFLGRHRRAWQTLHTFAWCLTERYEQFVPGKESEIRIENAEHWRALTGSNKGFVLATAHIGNWELGSRTPVSRESRIVNLVREQEIDPRSQAFVSALLAGAGGEGYRTHFASDDPSLGVRLLDALRSGEIVALQVDRPRAGGQVERVELFGTPYEFPVGPVALARLAGVPILPVFTLREGRRRYCSRFSPPIEIAAGPDRASDIREGLRRLAREIETVISENSAQWFCFREVRPRP
jgi:lauroyl/myristoyl acyltransferase